MRARNRAHCLDSTHSSVMQHTSERPRVYCTKIDSKEAMNCTLR